MAGPLIVGYDGTDGARAALAEALRLAGPLGAEVVVVFAYHAGRGWAARRIDLIDTLRERGDAVAEEALEMARAAGVPARAELVNDTPRGGARAASPKRRARSMIVVGSYGEAPLKAAHHRLDAAPAPPHHGHAGAGRPRIVIKPLTRLTATGRRG